MPVISGFGRLRQESHCKFKASLAYIVRRYLKQTKKNQAL